MDQISDKKRDSFTHFDAFLCECLTLFHASIQEGTPQLLEHNDIRWITAVEEVDQYPFCPADEVIFVKAERERIPKVSAYLG